MDVCTHLRFCLQAERQRRNIFSCTKGAPDSAGWSSLVARRAHNPEVVGSNPAPATKSPAQRLRPLSFFLFKITKWSLCWSSNGVPTCLQETVSRIITEMVSALQTSGDCCKHFDLDGCLPYSTRWNHMAERAVLGARTDYVQDMKSLKSDQKLTSRLILGYLPAGMLWSVLK